MGAGSFPLPHCCSQLGGQNAPGHSGHPPCSSPWSTCHLHPPTPPPRYPRLQGVQGAGGCAHCQRCGWAGPVWEQLPQRKSRQPGFPLWLLPTGLAEHRGLEPPASPGPDTWEVPLGHLQKVPASEFYCTCKHLSTARALTEWRSSSRGTSSNPSSFLSCVVR